MRDKDNSKDNSCKSPKKKGKDANIKSHNLRNSLTSSPLNTGLDQAGKSNVGKPPDNKSKGKPGTNESETNVSTKIINTLPTIFRYCSYDACKMITPQSAKSTRRLA